MRKQIILTADDYGCCDFIDNGVEDAILDGKINSVAAFVTHSDSKERIQELLSMKKILKADNKPVSNFGIGLHFSITSGKALTRKSTLTFPSADPEKGSYFRDAFGYDFGVIDPEDLKNELRQQLEYMRDIMGDEPIDHLSNHHGFVYLHESFYNAYTDVLKEFNQKHNLSIAMRSPVTWFRRFSAEPDESKNTSVCRIHFDSLDNKLITPAAIEGIRLMMWKKYFQTTYGIMKKRWDKAKDSIPLRCPDLLCDIIYGQATSKKPDGITTTLNEIFSVIAKTPLLECAGYADDFCAEMMFHVGKGNPAEVIAPHGVDMDYFTGRIYELETLKKYDLEHNLNITKTQKAIYADLKK